MSLLKWRDEYSVNVAKIDEQHRKLVLIINELHEARREKISDKVIGRLIDDIAEYARVHFKTEETYFQMYSYPRSGEHEAEHAELLRKVAEYKRKFEEKSDMFLAVRLAEFLNDWFYNHLMKSDARYAEFFAEKGVI